MSANPEIFPHQFTCNWKNNVEGTSGSYVVRYRFVPIEAPNGWKTYPGQECHDGRDGLLIEDSDVRWSEQDLWGATCEKYCLSIGCYGGVREYVCHAHTPDWHGDELERAVFERAEEAAAWASRWMADPEKEVARLSKMPTLPPPNKRLPGSVV